MTEAQIEFLKQIKIELAKRNTIEFEILIEEWAVFWMPWYIYIGKENVECLTKNIDMSDIEKFVDDGILRVVKIYSQDELDWPTEFMRKRYCLN